PSTRDFVNFGAYVLGSWTPTGDEETTHPVLRIDAGFRYDYNNIYGNQFNGRLGASLRVIEELTFKLNYSSAFRAPTSLLLYGRPLIAGDILGNSSLHPQQIHAWEAAVAARPWSWLRVQTSFSYSYLLDKAGFVQVGVNSVARNLAQIGVYAWETEARVSFEEQFYAYANFALVLGIRNLQEEGYTAALVGS